MDFGLWTLDLARLGIGHAPAVTVPIAQLHPAGAAAANVLVFGQILFGPAAPPIFELHAIWRRGGAFEVDDDLVNLPRILPISSIAFGQQQPEGGRIEWGRRQPVPVRRNDTHQSYESEGTERKSCNEIA